MSPDPASRPLEVTVVMPCLNEADTVAEKGYGAALMGGIAAAGGRVLPGAMPFLHYWLGNPLFSALARSWFGSPVRDICCGLRGFRREFQAGLGQRCTGMEFATEMQRR